MKLYFFLSLVLLSLLSLYSESVCSSYDKEAYQFMDAIAIPSGTDKSSL